MGKKGYLILTLFLILIVLVMSLPLVLSERFGYNNPSLPQLIENLFGGNPSSFYMPNNKSVFGNFSFDGTCLEGGVEIKNGIICGQILQVFNITSLNVTLQNLTIIDNLIVDGNITADFFFGNGSQLTDISASAIPDIYLFNTGDTATGNYTFDTDTFFIDSSSNKIGIRTITPKGTLHIRTADSSSGVLSTSFDDLVIENTDETGITILSPDNTDAGIVFGSPSNKFAVLMNWVFNNKLLSIGTLEADGEIAFFSGLDNEAMRIDSSGKVGIGTSTPQDTLNVVGDINATGDIFSNGEQVISYNRIVNIKNVTMTAVI